MAIASCRSKRKWSSPLSVLLLTFDTKGTYDGVGTRHHDDPTRSPPGHPRPPDPPHARDRAAARLGDLGADPGALPRRAARQPGLAVPGAPSPRAPGMDHIRVGRL